MTPAEQDSRQQRNFTLLIGGFCGFVILGLYGLSQISQQPKISESLSEKLERTPKQMGHLYNEVAQIFADDLPPLSADAMRYTPRFGTEFKFEIKTVQLSMHHWSHVIFPRFLERGWSIQQNEPTHILLYHPTFGYAHAKLDQTQALWQFSFRRSNQYLYEMQK